MGKVAPDTLKPLPTRTAELIVTGTLPAEVRVTDCVVCAPTWTLPNATLEALAVSAGTAAFNCSANVFTTPFAVAVRAAACAVETEVAFAVKVALVAPAGTVTAAGTITAAALLARPMLCPPVGAATFRVTLHASLAAPVRELLLHEIALTGARPVPVSPIVVVGFAEELLVIVSCADAAPAAAGLNCTLSVAVPAGFSVSGKVAPETLNAEPVTAAVLMVTGTVPVEVSVTVCNRGAPTSVFPNDRLVALAVNVAVAGMSCSAMLAEAPPEVAVIVAVCVVVTVPTVALKPVCDEPTAILTEEGTVAAALLLDKFTVVFAVATSLRYTEQALVPDPVIEGVPQETELSTGVAALAELAATASQQSTASTPLNRVPIPFGLVGVRRSPVARRC